jgi:hypothetical protein
MALADVFGAIASTAAAISAPPTENLAERPRPRDRGGLGFPLGRERR